MARNASTPSPGRELVQWLWKLPVFALPFAGFFLLVTGAPLRAFGIYYRVSLVFTLSAMIAVRATKQWIEPRMLRAFEQDPRRVWYVAVGYTLASVVGVSLGAIVIQSTIAPGFLGSGRGVLVMLVYCLLFAALFLGISLAITYYRDAVERAGTERELQLARRIQRSFLLSNFPARPRVELFATNVSSKEASGDFYDVVTPDDEHLLLAVADVSGKGVPAALLASMLQASLRTQAGTTTSPAAMLENCNRLACQRNSTGQFATFFLAALHEPTLTLRFSNGGHNFPVLVRAGGERVLLEKGGLVVGMVEGLPYEEGTLVLAEGDRLVIYTDGVTEAANAAGEMFEEERLYALLDAAPRELTAEQLVDRVIAGVRDFLAGTEAGDDITVLALRVLPAVRPGA